MTTQSVPRVTALDGLRGWAALSVAVFHFTWETFGARYDGLRHWSLSLLLDGRLAVAVFFGISAYVLTFDSWGDPDKTQLRRRLFKRYPRLLLPVLACTLLVLALMVTGLAVNPQAAPIVHRGDWGGLAVHFDASLPDAIRYAFGSAFLLDRGNDYNPFLWTMTYELWGSAAVLLVCWGERWLPDMRLTLAALTIAAAWWFPLAAPVMAGALVGRLHRDGLLAAFSQRRGANFTGLLLIAISLVLAGLLQWNGHAEPTGTTPVIVAIAATAILAGVIASPTARRFLERPFSQMLGRYSFPIYLAQFPVLITATSAMIIGAEAAGILTLGTALLIAAVSVALTFALARLLFIPVETLTARFNRWLERDALGLVARLQRRKRPEPQQS